MQIKKILIIGCGTLGLRIALRCAVDGYQVVMYDLTEEKLEHALTIQQKILKKLVIRTGLIDGSVAPSTSAQASAKERKIVLRAGT